FLLEGAIQIATGASRVAVRNGSIKDGNSALVSSGTDIVLENLHFTFCDWCVVVTNPERVRVASCVFDVGDVSALYVEGTPGHPFTGDFTGNLVTYSNH